MVPFHMCASEGAGAHLRMSQCFSFKCGLQPGHPLGDGSTLHGASQWPLRRSPSSPAEVTAEGSMR